MESWINSTMMANTIEACSFDVTHPVVMAMIAAKARGNMNGVILANRADKVYKFRSCYLHNRILSNKHTVLFGPSSRNGIPRVQSGRCIIIEGAKNHLISSAATNGVLSVQIANSGTWNSPYFPIPKRYGGHYPMYMPWPGVVRKVIGDNLHVLLPYSFMPNKLLGVGLDIFEYFG